MRTIKPCMFCRSTNIEFRLEMDCYSSWAKAICKNCYAFSKTGVDKSTNTTYPNPVAHWKSLVITKWNNAQYKKAIVSKRWVKYDNKRKVIHTEVEV